jgi:hypothetical protein
MNLVLFNFLLLCACLLFLINDKRGSNSEIKINNDSNSALII